MEGKRSGVNGDSSVNTEEGRRKGDEDQRGRDQHAEAKLSGIMRSPGTPKKTERKIDAPIHPARRSRFSNISRKNRTKDQKVE